MNKIFKMDIYRVTHSVVFYVSIAFITVMAFSLVYSGMSTSLDALMGVAGSSAEAGDDFMASTMGTGIIFILTSIILSLFVCGDYSGGFAKNIFTTHSRSMDYIGGKMLSMAAVNGFMLVLYAIESIVTLGLMGHGIAFSGSFLIGLIFFLIEKLLIACALSAVILLIVAFTRSIAWGIFGGFLIATGGLTLGVSLFSEAFNLGWLETLLSVTISGSSKLCSLAFDPLIFIRVLIASVAWFVIASLLSDRTLRKKDI